MCKQTNQLIQTKKGKIHCLDFTVIDAAHLSEEWKVYFWEQAESKCCNQEPVCGYPTGNLSGLEYFQWN